MAVLQLVNLLIMHNPMTLEKKISHLLNSFKGTPPALALDFDGVISELKKDPRTASIDKHCLKLIVKLTNILPNISIISGRSTDDLKSKVGLDNLTYMGNHGAEYIEGGQIVRQSPEGTEEIIKSALDYIKLQTYKIDGLVHENKTISASVHYRGARDHSKTKEILTTILTNTPNIDKLDIFWGKQILEIRPHSKFNKGYAINELIKTKNITNILFFGDDTTDLDAMIELKKLRESNNISGFSIYVSQDNESNEQLLNNSDCSIKGISEVRKTLEQIFNKFDSVR